MRRPSPGVVLPLALAGVLFWLPAGCRRGDPSTPAESEARGRELIQQSSASLRSATTLTFDTTEKHERVRRNGEKRAFSLSRQMKVRRPDRLTFHAKSDGGEDLNAFYDGRSLTLLGNAQKVYAQVDAPNTIDALLDRLAERFDVPMPMADLLYSDPGQSFDLSQFKGGWVKRAQIDGASCHELHYTGKEAEFTLWVADDARALPCRLAIVYSARTGKPTSDITFRNWKVGDAIADGDFAANVPSGYEKIPIIERIPKDELKADAAKAMGVASK